MKKSLVVLTIVIMMLSISAIPVFADDPGTGNSDFVIQNIDAAVATVTVDYYDQTGAADVPGTPITINGHGSRVFEASTLPIGDGWIGSVVVSADKQVAAMTNLTWQSTFGSIDDQITGAAYSGTYNPGTDLYFGYATIKPVGSIPGKQARFSIVTIQNAGTADAHIHMSYYNQTTGAVTGPIADTIGAGRSKSYNLSLTADPKVPALGGNWQGSVFVHSDDQPIAGVVTTHWAGAASSQWGSAYEGVSAGASTIYGPSVSRVNKESDPAVGTWVRSSNVLVMNTGTAPANVMIGFFATGSTIPAMVINDTIPPKQMGEYNTRFGSPTNAAYPAAAFQTALGNTFNGAVAVTCTNGQPIAGVVHGFWNRPDENSASSYTMIDHGATDIYIPYAPRKQPSAWTTWSKIAVSNLSASTANLTITFYKTDGTAALPAPILATIAGNSGDAYNTRTGSDSGAVPASAFTALGSAFVGNVWIHSTQPIIGVVNVIFKPTESNTYGAYIP